MRFLKVLPLFISYGFLVLLANFLLWGDFKQHFINALVSIHSKLFLKALGCDISIIGDLPSEGNHLIICNHLSYADVLTIASLIPAVFVTSQDMAKEPIPGTIVKLAGCLLVDRKGFKTLLSDIKQMSILLDSGFNIVLFPEATTSSTGNTLPFKPSLITAAEHAGIPVLSLAIRYNNLEHIVFCDRHSFVPHFLRFIKKKGIKIEVEICDLSHPSGDRKQTAKRLHKVISSKAHRY